MSLNNPDSRRALRSVIQAIIALVLVGLVAWMIHLLANEPSALVKIALSTLFIVGMGTLFYGGENLARAIKLRGPLGLGAEIGGDEQP